GPPPALPRKDFAMNPDALTAVEMKIIHALCNGLSLTAAAAQAGVPLASIFLWRHDHPLFRRNLQDAIEAHGLILQDNLRQLPPKGVDALGQILDAGDLTPAVKFRAAQFVLAACIPMPARAKPAAQTSQPRHAAAPRAA